MAEPIDNLALLCPEHRLKPNPRMIAAPAEFFAGRYVKAPFPGILPGKTGPSIEWMWVEVIEVLEKEIRGLLANDPFARMELRLGDTVIVKKTEIHSVFDPKIEKAVEP